MHYQNCYIPGTLENCRSKIATQLSAYRTLVATAMIEKG